MRTALLVGGIGRLTRDYTRAATNAGWQLQHHEAGALETQGRRAPAPDLVLVCTAVCSHPLREAAQEIARRRGVPIVYLSQPSASALRRALTQHEETIHA